MSKAPAFQMYANDFMDATRLWEANAVGLYIRCLCIQWTHGSIPADPRVLARAVHCERAELEECWHLLAPKFDLSADGTTMTNSRLEEVRDRQKEVSEKRSEAGKAGAIARANARSVASDLPLAKDKQRKVKEKEKEEGEVEMEVEGRQPRQQKRPDARIDECIQHFTERAGHKPADASKWMRIHVSNLLKWVTEKDPEGDPVINAKSLIDAALSIDFHKNNATTFRYLYDYRETIYKTYKSSHNGQSSKGSPATPDEAARATAEYFDRKRAGQPANG